MFSIHCFPESSSSSLVFIIRLPARVAPPTPPLTGQAPPTPPNPTPPRIPTPNLQPHSTQDFKDLLIFGGALFLSPQPGAIWLRFFSLGNAKVIVLHARVTYTPIRVPMALWALWPFNPYGPMALWALLALWPFGPIHVPEDV